MSRKKQKRNWGLWTLWTEWTKSAPAYLPLVSPVDCKRLADGPIKKSQVRAHPPHRAQTRRTMGTPAAVPHDTSKLSGLLPYDGGAGLKMDYN